MPTPQQIKVHQIKTRVAPLLDSQQYAIAIDLLEGVLPLDRKDAMLHKMLGAGYAGLQNMQKATVHLRRATELGHRDADTLLSLASVYKDTGDSRGALRTVEQLLNELPAEGRANRFKAFLLRSMGEADKALAWIDTVHDRIGPHPDTMILRAELLTRFKRHDEAEADLRSLLDDTATSDGHRRDAFYALGQLLDKTERYDEAFESISKANHMQPAAQVVTPEMFAERWTSEAIADIPLTDPGAEQPGDRPVFVIGMPRSGTTLTEQIIAAHPDAISVGESGALNTLARGLMPEDLTADRLRAMALAYLDETSPPQPRGKAKQACRRVVDKLPENYYYLAAIARSLPGARVIHCTRDPRDVALSCFFQNFGTRLGWTRRLETIAQQQLLYKSVMGIWRETLETEIYESNYETLTTDPEPNVRAMLEHIRLPFNEACLAHHKNKSTVRTASVDQVRNPIYTSSQQRWKRYEKHLGPILDSLDLS